MRAEVVVRRARKVVEISIAKNGIERWMVQMRLAVADLREGRLMRVAKEENWRVSKLCTLPQERRGFQVVMYALPMRG